MSDYLLGLSDLMGELMRFAISGISRRGGRTKANEICAFVRNCKAGGYTNLDSRSFSEWCFLARFRALDSLCTRSFQETSCNCTVPRKDWRWWFINFRLFKLGLLIIPYLAAYAIAVRGSEYDLPQDILDDMVAASISAFSTSGYGHSELRGGSERRTDDDAHAM